MAASGVSRRGRKEGAIFRLGKGRKNLRNENGVVRSEARDTNARARPHARGTSKPAHLGHAAPQSHPPCTQTHGAHTPRVCKHAQDPARTHPRSHASLCARRSSFAPAACSETGADRYAQWDRRTSDRASAGWRNYPGEWEATWPSPEGRGLG